MALQSIRLKPGIVSTQTPTLNEAGWSVAQNIRFFQGMAQKEGGWIDFTNVLAGAGIPRSMRAWTALSFNSYLGIACTNRWNVFLSEVVYDITPLTISANSTLLLTTVAGSTDIVITSGATPTLGEWVMIVGAVSVGGLVLSGAYEITAVGVGAFTITSPNEATLDETDTGVPRTFTTTAGSAVVNVLLPNHNLFDGAVISIPVAVSVGGLTLQNNYLATVVDAGNFTITAGALATMSQAAAENGGLLSLVFLNPASGGSQNDIPAITASLDNWGEFLIGNQAGGPIFVWQPGQGVTTPATNVATAPQRNNFSFVSIQVQQLIVCGTTNLSAPFPFDPMLLAWSDTGDYTDFLPDVTNQAGSFRLAIGSKLTAGLIMVGMNLIWTDLALYAMSYIQPPLVWGFQPLGVNCGAVGPHSVGILAGVVYWMSQNQFFTLGPSGPTMIDCPVWDQVFLGLAKADQQYVVCETNSFYGEVGWSVPQTDGPVIFVRMRPDPTLGNQWTASTSHHHSAWIDQSVFGSPLGGHEDGLIDQHDSGVDAAGEALPTSLTSGIAMISEGDEAAFIRDFYPDFNWLGTTGTLDLTVYFYDYPESTPRAHGPFAITPTTKVIHPRGRGRGVQFKLEGNDIGSNWRIGNLRYRGQADGKR